MKIFLSFPYLLGMTQLSQKSYKIKAIIFCSIWAQTAKQHFVSKHHDKCRRVVTCRQERWLTRNIAMRPSFST